MIVKEESLDLEETLVPNINVSGEDRDADVYSDNDDGNMDEGFQTINVKGKDLIFPINGGIVILTKKLIGNREAKF